MTERVLLVFGCLVSVISQTFGEPAFCHKLDCPKYTVEETFKTYEVRKYEPSYWVATNITKMEFTEQDRRDLFNKLLQYISGNNVAKMKIPMTAPVLDTVLHGQGPDCESNFTTHFMVPFALQDSPPAPSSADVYLTSYPAMTVYVRTFSGFIHNETDVTDQVAQLTDDIGDSSKYIANPYSSAVYDNPYQVINRHNEVWLQQA